MSEKLRTFISCCWIAIAIITVMLLGASQWSAITEELAKELEEIIGHEE